MLYNSAEEQAKDQKIQSDDQIKLGKVTSINSSGLPKVQINGSRGESSKIYPVINSYTPKVNDVVLLQKQGLSYVIIGAIETNSLQQQWASLNHNHDSSYSAIGHNHDSAYSAIGHNHDTAYAAKTHSHDEYEYPSTLYYGSGTSRANVALNATGGSFNGYSTLSSSTSKNISNSLVPKSNTGYALGSSSYPFLAGYIDYIFAKNVGTPSKKCAVVASDYYGGTYIGSSSSKFTNAYITTIYGTVSSSGSDRRIKDKIADLGEKFKKFFAKLRPVSYVFTTEDTDNKTHTGFIAQEVEEALKETELEELGIVTQDEAGQYYLNYNEFIAIQTEVIQDLQSRIDALEKRVAEMEDDNK